MNPAWTLTFVALVPFLCLGLLLWLARLEETLTDGLDGPRATRKPAPAPVLAEAPAPAPTHAAAA